MKVSSNNIEQLIFQLKEGMLDDAERACVEKALAENDEWRKMAEMYDPTLQLPQYPHIEYPDKDKLRAIAHPAAEKTIIATESKSNSTRHIVFPLWSRVAAACAIIAVIVLLFRLIDRKPDNNLTASGNPKTTIDSTIESLPIHATPTPDNADSLDNADKVIAIPKNEAPIETMIAENQEESSDYKPDYLYSDDLITYIDDDDSSFEHILLSETQDDDFQHPNAETSSDKIRLTDKLVTYYDDDQPVSNDPYYERQPVWQATMNDWWSNLQLASLEFQTNMVNNINKYIEHK